MIALTRKYVGAPANSPEATIAVVEVDLVLATTDFQVVLFVLASILYPAIVAPKVETGRLQVSFALAVCGLVETQASLTLTDRTELAAVTGAAFAACAGASSEIATKVATMLPVRRRDLLTGLAYCSNLGIV